MKYLPWCSLLLFFCATSYAQFDISGEGKVHTSKGSSQEFDFGFSYFRQEGSYRFIVGRHTITVSSVPKKYSLALIFQDDDKVWVPDFINEPLDGFEFEVEGYELKLYKDTNAADAKGNYVFELDGEAYYFNRGPGQVSFHFTEDGIKDVKVEGMLKARK